EIYNFQELRAELQKSGHKFRSRTDTEVLIHGYEEWGTDLLPRLNGMFSFALLDLRSQDWEQGGPSLLLARDRFGIKPLYYVKAAARFLFASEIKAILLSDLVARDVNLEALQAYLSFLWVPGPETLFSEIEQLPPGHYLAWRDGSHFVRKYSDIEFSPDESLDEEAAVAELR